MQFIRRQRLLNNLITRAQLTNRSQEQPQLRNPMFFVSVDVHAHSIFLFCISNWSKNTARSGPDRRQVKGVSVAIDDIKKLLWQKTSIIVLVQKLGLARMILPSLRPERG